MPGLPKKYIKKYGVSKRAWREYRKDKGSTKRKRSRMGRGEPNVRRKTVSRTVRRISRKRRMNPVGKKRGFLTTSTFMKFARLFALAAPAAAVAMGPGDAPSKIKEGTRIYTGFDMNTGEWSLANIAGGWLPFVGTTLITVGIQKLSGMIRRL